MACRKSVVNQNQIKYWFSWSLFSSMADRQKGRQTANQPASHPADQPDIRLLLRTTSLDRDRAKCREKVGQCSASHKVVRERFSEGMSRILNGNIWENVILVERSLRANVDK